MEFDPELEEILNAIKNKETSPEKPATPIDLPPPKPLRQEPLPQAPEIDDVSPVKADDAAPEKKETPKKKMRYAKKPLLTFLAVLLVAALGIGVFSLSQAISLKRYEAKYKVTFPKGIPHEFCEAYGKNQSLAGSILIKDNNSETLIYSEPKQGEALFEKGSTLKQEQYYRAAALEVSDADLEALYKDGDSFLASSQSFTFKTVTGEKQKYQVIAAYIVNTDPKDDNGYVFPYNCYGNFTEKSYRHYQDAVTRRSLYNTKYKITPDDYCMTLSVPTDIMPGFRFVIVGVRRDKISKITAVKENPMLHYPQAYCDKLGIHNVFARFSTAWYPEIIVDKSTGTTKQLTAQDFE